MSTVSPLRLSDQRFSMHFSATISGFYCIVPNSLYVAKVHMHMYIHFRYYQHGGYCSCLQRMRFLERKSSASSDINVQQKPRLLQKGKRNRNIKRMMIFLTFRLCSSSGEFFVSHVPISALFLIHSSPVITHHLGEGRIRYKRDSLYPGKICNEMELLFLASKFTLRGNSAYVGSL